MSVTQPAISGPPGSGKGTQSPSIRDEYCLCHLATSDMLRAAVTAKTPSGIKAKEAMDNGQLLSDDLLDEILEKQGNKVDKVLNFAIYDAILEERITGHWICPSTGKTYHTKFAPPKVPGVDDVITGEPLIQRKDDPATVLKSRLEAFHKQTEPVIDYYSKKGIVAYLPLRNLPKRLFCTFVKADFDINEIGGVDF
ncbi:Adenylate kinase 4 [Glycine max]|nr:Adenylate kinase 4 [Glycine max]